MPRAKEFDPDEVLEQVMELFWEQGFASTSAQDLVDCTGLNRSSLYNTFGCKQQLYLAALDRYCRQGADLFADLLDQDISARDAVRRVFKQATLGAAQGGRGCFVANATVERARCDEATCERACNGMAQIQHGFQTLIERGQARGEISEKKEAEAMAHFLMNTYFGLQTMGKVSPPEKLLGDVVNVALRALE